MSAPVASQPAVITRSARAADIPAMLKLMAPYVVTGDLLPRTTDDLEPEIERYVVALDGAVVVGTGALKPYSPDLGEVIALAVEPAYQRQGVGRRIVDALVHRAARLGISEVFALTRKPAFFYRLGFTLANKDRFPQKVWFDCTRCPRRLCCDEIAVHFPDVASWSPPA